MTGRIVGHAIEYYLDDHLAGATGTIPLLGELADRETDETERHFYLGLQEQAGSDRELLKELIRRAGMAETILARMTGNIRVRAGKLKLTWEGLDPAKLGQAEALEMLALGIQGKRLLWNVLAEVAPFYPEWEGIDFAMLARDAKEQRDAVEQRRLSSGRVTPPGPERSRCGS